MKVLLLVLVSVATLEVCVGRAVDEKQTAVTEIKNKFSEVKTSSETVANAIKTEKNGAIASTAEKDALIQLNKKINATKIQFENDVKAAIRTAIVHSKPMNVIHCIREVSYSSSAKIGSVNESSIKKVTEIKTNKLRKIGFDDYAVKAILSGLQELIDQSISKINQSSGVEIDKIKKAALLNCDSAMLLLGEIEVGVHDPVLGKEYAKVRQEIDRLLRETADGLNKKLDECLKITK